MIVATKCDMGKSSIVFETGLLAKQANGSVIVRSGDTVILVAACMSKDTKPGQDFLPLTVEYSEKTYAAGKIPGGFFKREGRPSGKATLTMRIIDRPLRPLFPENFFRDVVIHATVLSVDGVTAPEILALNGASAALGISNIPLTELVGGVRVGKIDGVLVANPTREEMDRGTIDLLVASTKKNIIMVESGAKEVSESEMLEALMFGFDMCQKSIAAQEEMVQKCGQEKLVVPPVELNATLLKDIEKRTLAAIKESYQIKGKQDKAASAEKIYTDLIATLTTEKGAEWMAENKSMVKACFEDIKVREWRRITVQDKVRVDGRGTKDIRSISINTGFLPRTHGSSLFTRGETQALCVTTLAGPGDSQLIDALEGEYEEKFLLHYNFPHFSVGEARAPRSPSRREIGHGALAEKAIRAVLPPPEKFPYVVRVVSEILESNGSSSMATVCGTSLSLMDAGVPLTAPCAGIAMGLIADGDKYALLTDIQGEEDHYGDMDFKIAGTEKGITALQLDCKIAGLSQQILKETLDQAREGRLFILKKMNEVIREAKKEMSPYAPRIETIVIDPDKIRLVIGPGGKMIKKITEETKAKIDIEDDGTIHVTASDVTALKKAREMIDLLTAEAEVGKTYNGKVTRLMKFGAFMEILPGTEGLCHISQLALTRVNNVEDVVKIGDRFPVKVVEIDQQGRVNLSRKVLLQPAGGETTE